MTKNIWPRQLPNSIRNDSRYRAEVKVYDRLFSQLSDEFHVFYSSPWLAIDRFGNEKDGECDFVVAHKSLGVLAIEVKGGGIDFNPEKNQWTSTDRNGVVHNIKNPVNQARSAKYQIRERLKKTANLRQRKITVRHGVIFPDASKPPRELGADRPTRIFCASREFDQHFDEWVRKRFLGSNKNSGSKNRLGPDGIAALERLFAQPISLGFSLSSSISDDVRELNLLGQQQFHIIDHISYIPKVRIEGAAGTGKTVIALETALRSGKSGKRTLLTCYNLALAKELRRLLDGIDNVTVLSFHALCLHFARITELPVEQKQDDDAFFEQDLPELLIRAIEINRALRFDCIIVDEGQDFLDYWWIAMEEALGEDGIIRVFCDSNQRLYDRSSEFIESLDLLPIPLKINYRNTVKIHRASTVHYTGPESIPEGPQGINLNWIEVKEESSIVKAAFKEVKRLVFQEELNPADIAVLVPNQSMREAFMVATAHSGLDFVDAERLFSDAVVVDTVRRFKGLERAAIVLCIVETEAGLSELAYSGMTRARAALSVVCHPKDRQWIEKGW